MTSRMSAAVARLACVHACQDSGQERKLLQSSTMGVQETYGSDCRHNLLVGICIPPFVPDAYCHGEESDAGDFEQEADEDERPC